MAVITVESMPCIITFWRGGPRKYCTFLSVSRVSIGKHGSANVSSVPPCENELTHTKFQIPSLLASATLTLLALALQNATQNYPTSKHFKMQHINGPQTSTSIYINATRKSPMRPGPQTKCEDRSHVQQKTTHDDEFFGLSKKAISWRNMARNASTRKCTVRNSPMVPKHQWESGLAIPYVRKNKGMHCE